MKILYTCCSVIFIIFIFSCFLEKDKRVTNIDTFIFADDIKISKQKGVRDFIWCLEKGAIHKIDDQSVGYFNAFPDDDSFIGPTIYRVVKKKGKKDITRIVLEKTKGVDDLGTSLGSVIYSNGNYHLYYSGLVNLNGVNVYHTYNVAESKDGIVFTQKKTLLTNDDFPFSVHIGLPYTLLLNDTEDYIMVCEGINKKTKSYCVYGAYGKGDKFLPINNGNPIITSDSIPWPFEVGGVANPKLKQGEKGNIYIGFNAADSGINKSAWRLGLGKFSFNDGKICDIHLDKKPLVLDINKSLKRIESAEIVYDRAMNPKEIYFFATPTYDATLGSVIYSGSFIK